MVFRDGNFKPNSKTTNGLSFHGKTEYQGSFIDEKKERKEDKKAELTLNQLQNFIIDL